MLNEDGTPKVFYHGTAAEFTEFDKKKARSGLYGRGFYFTDSKSKRRSDNTLRRRWKNKRVGQTEVNSLKVIGSGSHSNHKMMVSQKTENVKGIAKKSF